MADEPTALPPPVAGAAQPPMNTESAPGVIIDNRSDAPDDEVRHAIMAQFTESAALQFGQPSSFQLYASNQGSNMLSRSPFRVPSNVIEEIKLARQVADTDDDIAAVIGQAIATAFGDGMQNQHEDEQTGALFNKICGPVAAGGMNMDRLLKEMYREYLIAASFTTLSLFSRTRYNFTPQGGEERVQAQLATPLVGVLPAENIRVLTNDIFGNAELAYEPTDQALKDWLEAFFAPRTVTSPAKKNQMAQEQPILAAVFTERVEVPWNDSDMFSAGKVLYKLNPRMCHRTTMAKGASAYPRPLLTANFALLEAKRLLNIMDYSLLQGGTNYIVIARQGSDKLPAKQPEIDNLVDQVRSASRTGVLVGDHRLEVDIITPKLEELLNSEKRKLVGRKIAMALMRIPEPATDDPGGEGARAELEFTARTITSDRRDIKRHIEGNVYEEIANRNASTFKKGAPSLWFPKIILWGVKDFFDSIIKARDRGDIPRKYAVEVLGYDYEAGVAQRKREQENGDDEVMVPGSVPYSPQDGRPPSDTPEGRPPGSSPSNGRPGGAPPGQTAPALPPGVRAGEDIAAHWDADAARTVRYGELTVAVVEQYPDHQQGRVSQIEREAIAAGENVQRASVIVIPVNPAYDVGEMRAFRLSEGLSMVVGQRASDNALVAKALTFREPHFDLTAAEDTALRWGFVTAAHHRAALVVPEQPQPVSPPSAEDVAAAIVGQVRAATTGVDLAAVVAGVQASLGQVVAEAVAKALEARPEPPAPEPTPPPQS